MPPEELLFVYGTLRRGYGHPLHQEILNHARPLGLARYQGYLYDLGPYPAATPAPAGLGGVMGEVYALENPGPLLNTLDVYEGCMDPNGQPGEYRPERVPVTLETGNTVLAWIYLYNSAPPEARRIPGGDYLAGGQSVTRADGRDSPGDDGAS